MTTRPKSPAALVQAVRIAREDPRATFRVSGDFDMNAGDVLRMWTRGVQARASRGLPALSARGERRYAELQRHQRDLALDQRVVDDYVQRRIRQTGSSGLLRTEWMRKLYPHINCQPREH